MVIRYNNLLYDMCLEAFTTASVDVYLMRLQVVTSGDC